MKQFSKILILITMGLYGTSTIAADAIPLEAKAAAEAQKAALEYSENQKSDSDSDWKQNKAHEGLYLHTGIIRKKLF